MAEKMITKDRVKLILDKLDFYRQENAMISNLNAPIEVDDISKTEISFVSQSVLPIGYYFNAELTFASENPLHSVIQIIRSQPAEGNRTLYRCEFIGMATVLSYLFKENDLLWC